MKVAIKRFGLADRRRLVDDDDAGSSHYKEGCKYEIVERNLD